MLFPFPAVQLFLSSKQQVGGSSPSGPVEPPKGGSTHRGARGARREDAPRIFPIR